MTQQPGMTLSDLERLIEAEAPDFVPVLVAFCKRPEPIREEPEHLDLRALRSGLSRAAATRGVDAKKRRQEQAHELWKRYLTQPGGVAPQIQVAELIESLYTPRTPPRRRLLFDVIEQAPLVFGVWGGLKRVYKRAEEDLDAAVIGAFSARIDGELRRPTRGTDVSPATLRYLSRRIWRFLRMLGKASPELYPAFAVEALRAAGPESTFHYTSVAGRIARHAAPKWGGMDPAARRASTFPAPYRDAWARSADPLLLLLETCKSDAAAQFAIAGLRDLFPATLRNPSPEWMAKLCFRPLASAHELVIGALEGSPDYHAAKLASLGLHDAVIALLQSPLPRARQYAMAYARGRDLSTELLVSLLKLGMPDVTLFASELLTARPPRSVGLDTVARLIEFSPARSWAQQALDHAFDKSELTPAFLATILSWSFQWRWFRAFVDRRFPHPDLPPAFWIGLLADARLPSAPANLGAYALDRLGKFDVAQLPADWLLSALGDDVLRATVSEWLEETDALPTELTAERLRGLVFDPLTRAVAFDLLGRTKLFEVEDVGVGWLLALVRRADPSLHEWAREYLLAHVAPDQLDGADRVFGLAVDAHEPARLFAHEYLVCHHPRIGRLSATAKRLGIEPALPREVYTFDRVWPMLWDDRADVRRFAVVIVRSELRRWGQPSRVYEMAESPNKEVRNVAYAAFGRATSGEEDAGGPAADKDDLVLSPEELDPVLVFSLTESRISTTRDVAMALIREQYDRLGGAERLAWLMSSADREVRMFAVRLLWERHRTSAARGASFDDRAALASLLRRQLFSIPPARGGQKVTHRRRLPANVAKRRLIEVVRDLAVADRSFALLVVPILSEMTGSIARGEWQSCLSALLTVRAAHGLTEELAAPEG